MLKVVPVAYRVDPHAHCSMQSMMTCYNLSGEPEYDDELQNVNILESEGSHDVVALNILTDPMKIRKVNVGS